MGGDSGAFAPYGLAFTEPLVRAGDRDAGRRLDAVLAVVLEACRTLGAELAPFLPDAAERVAWQCAVVDGRLPAPSPVFARLARR